MKRGLVAALAVVAWWLVASLRFSGRAAVATPLEALVALPPALPTLLRDLGATTARAGAGLAIGIVAGLVVGGLASLVRKSAPSVEAPLDFARSIPPVVLLPAFLLAFGWNDTARIATIAAGSVWVMALSVTAAASRPRTGRQEVLELAGASKLTAIAWTQPWESLGVLVVGLRTSASMSVIVAVVTEMVAGADHGIGMRVIAAQISGDAVAFTHAVLAIGAVGWALNLGLRRLEARVTRNQK